MVGGRCAGWRHREVELWVGLIDLLAGGTRRFGGVPSPRSAAGVGGRVSPWGTRFGFKWGGLALRIADDETAVAASTLRPLGPSEKAFAKVLAR